MRKNQRNLENSVSHRPRKRFGQNFLQNPQIIDQILNALQLNVNDNVLEIGPGQGALTRPLLSQLKNLHAIEIDRDLLAFLSGLETASHAGRLQLIEADALTVDYRRFGTDLRIIGNLPYNISTPLLFHLISFIDTISDMHFMLQKEVVMRLASPHGCKNYGRLSVMMQYLCEVDHVLDVPPEAFYPVPKVYSALVRLKPHPKPVYPEVDLLVLEKLVALAFSMRRKTLANNLKSLVSADFLRNLHIDPGFRPEQISVGEYVTIANSIPETT